MPIMRRQLSYASFSWSMYVRNVASHSPEWTDAIEIHHCAVQVMVAHADESMQIRLPGITVTNMGTTVYRRA